MISPIGSTPGTYNRGLKPHPKRPGHLRSVTGNTFWQPETLALWLDCEEARIEADIVRARKPSLDIGEGEP